MKRLLFAFLLLVVFVSTAVAEPNLDSMTVLMWTGTVATTREDMTDYAHSGYLDQVDVIFESAGTTGTVKVLTVTNEWYDIESTLLTVTAGTASAPYRPRFPIHTAAGNSLTNDVARYFLYNQKVKIQAYSSTVTNQRVTVRIKIDKN